jgi:TatD DNase family protein
MKLTDTHCHLNADTFNGRWEAVWQEAIGLGVTQCFVIGWNQTSSEIAIHMSRQRHNIKAVIGLHPVDIKDQTNLDWISHFYHDSPEYIVAVGEIGLDYYWKKTDQERDVQKTYFIHQIEIANTLNLPIVVHCRDAYAETLAILQAHKPIYGGVMHCYAGPASMIPEFVQLGMYFSYGGPITFKNAHEARLSLLQTPLDRLLIETDSPYLTPTPFRGQENTPAKLPLIFETAKNLLKLNDQNLEDILEENKNRLFHVKTK